MGTMGTVVFWDCANKFTYTVKLCKFYLLAGKLLVTCINSAVDYAYIDIPAGKAPIQLKFFLVLEFR